MNIKKVDFLTDKNEIISDGTYSDIKWWLSENHVLKVTSQKNELRKIIIETDVLFSGDEIILGDCFERAYGDLNWEKISERLIPWYFLVKDKDTIRGYGVKTQPNAICWWKIDSGRLYFIADIGSGKNGLDFSGNILEVCSFVTEAYNGDAFVAVCDFCKKMCDNPRLPKLPVYGGNDWYCNYGNNSFEKIIEHTRRIAECAENLENRPYMVIDDGWQLCHHNEEGDEFYYNGGPWAYANRRFVNMKALADEIKSYNVIPGIWLRPLLTIESIPKKLVMRQTGIRYVLDPSVTEALEIVKNDIARIKEWGYKLIKHDFSTFDIFGRWGFDFSENFTDDVNFADKTRTSAQIIKDFYKAIREAAGDDIVIIGCNTISHLSAGFFEIQRTGDDTSGFDFERTKKMGINTLAFRIPQHNAFYSADADCVGITTGIPWEKNRQWLDVLSKSGTPLFVSIADDAYTDEIKSDLIEAFKRADENDVVSQPLDWEYNSIPDKWKSSYGIDEYTW